MMVLAKYGRIPMENGVLNKTTRQEWLPANPWPWTFLGLGICLVNVLTVLISQASLNIVGAGCVFGGLLIAAAGVTIRLNSSASSFVDRLFPEGRFLVLMGLALLFALIAVAAAALPVLHFLDIRPTGWRLSGLVLLCVIVGPLSVAAMIVCFRRAQSQLSCVGPGRRRGRSALGRGYRLLLALGILQSQ